MEFKQIFEIKNQTEFQRLALQIFNYQFENNKTYRSFCDLLYVHPADVKELKDIPFLPIRFFKSHDVLSSSEVIQQTFLSSGTTGSTSSKHHITDLVVYEKSYLTAFQQFYGNIDQHVVLALLPAYLERKDSSLVYMVNDLIKKSKHPKSGFYLSDLDALSTTLKQLDDNNQKVLLIGVSFALLDLIEKNQFCLKNTIVMETGGMKGRRREMVRTELHQILKKGFDLSEIHSEYGMTELLSQAYSKGDGIFYCPPWMQVLSRNIEDPLTIQNSKKTGGLNVIDLANYNSCSFIATQDLGRVFGDGSFEILGRFDHADVRGCNLMII